MRSYLIIYTLFQFSTFVYFCTFAHNDLRNRQLSHVVCVCPECFHCVQHSNTPASKVKDFLQICKQFDEYLIVVWYSDRNRISP